jgi:hypothetical protein
MFKVSNKAICDIKNKKSKDRKNVHVETGAKGILFTARQRLLERRPLNMDVGM